MKVKVLQDILSANDGIARRNQSRLDKHCILTINVMSSPGAGKTSLILQTINNLKEKARIAVIEGDIASSLDADKVLAKIRGNLYGVEAAIIGEVVNEHPGQVIMKASLGASRIIDMPVGELLPRIC